MRTRLCRRRDGIVVLVAMASFPLPMHRHLTVVNDDGNGATGNSIVDNCDSAMNVNNDGNGATDDDINDNGCDGQRCQPQ